MAPQKSQTSNFRVSSPRGNHSNQESTKFLDWLRSLLFWALVPIRRWPTTVLAFILSALATAALCLQMQPLYRAVGLVLLHTQDYNLEQGDQSSFLRAAPRMELPHVESRTILTSTALLEIFHDLKLNLRNQSLEQSPVFDRDTWLSRSRPPDPVLLEVRNSLELLQIPDVKLNNLAVRMISNTNDIISVYTSGSHLIVPLNTTVQNEFIKIRFSKNPFPPGRFFEFKVWNDSNLLDQLGKNARARVLHANGYSTNFIEVEYTSVERASTSEFVNKIMERYVDQDRIHRDLKAKQISQFLTKQLKKTDIELVNRERSLSIYQERFSLIDLPLQAKIAIQQGAAIRAELLQLAVQKSAPKLYGSSELGTFAGGGQSGLVRIVRGRSTDAHDAILESQTSNLLEENIAVARSASSRTSSHPQFLQELHQLNIRKTALDSLAKHSQLRLNDRTHSLQHELRVLISELNHIPSQLQHLVRKSIEIEARKVLKQKLLEGFHQVNINRVAIVSPRRIVERALPPQLPYSRRPRQFILFSILGAIAFSLAISHLRQLWSRKICGFDDIVQELDWPVLARLPEVKKMMPLVGTNLDDSLPQETLTFDDSIQLLAAQLRFLSVNRQNGFLVQVTSTLSGEGKSTTLAHLAHSLARTGAKVLIADLDLRRPSQHRLWKTSRIDGLTEFVIMGGDLELLAKTPVATVPNLMLLTSGCRTVEPMEVLQHERLAQLFDAARISFDFVLVDGPPVFLSDSSVIATYVDLLVAVVRPQVADKFGLRQLGQKFSDFDQSRRILVVNGSINSLPR